MFHLLQRPMNIGNDKKSDILVEETGVERRHARLTRGERGPTIWDVGTDIGVLVNGVRKTSCELRAGDLIKMGEALLLALLEPQAGAVIPEPLSPTLIEGEPVAKLHVDQGLRRGETFYMSRRPLVIGRHRLAGVRLEDRRVAPFHIHLAPTPSGIRITDLKSSSGVRINDKTVTEALLRTGDLIEIGEAHLRFEQTGEVAPPEPEPPEAQQEAQADDLPDIPLTAELDMGDKAGAGALGAAGQAAAAPPVERYGPGDLVLTAVEGPIQGQFKAIEKPRTIVGRGGVADLVIPDLSVSRKHALIMLSPQGVLEIQDLGSRNGIHVNGRKVTKAALKAGDAIRIGTTVLMVDRRAP
jgi:pSer/pThr/pTyr-binding forkhead associated (FHA) protein